MTPILNAVIPWRPVPYHRVGGGKAARWSTKAKRYHASQERVWQHLRLPPTPLTRKPVRVGVAVFLDPVKSGPRKGLIPANKGDWDNYYKAVVDCLVHYGALVEDHAGAVAGPGDVMMSFGQTIPSGCYLATEGERVIVTVWEVDHG